MRIGKVDPLPRQPIEHGRRNLRCRIVTGEIAVTQIVGQLAGENHAVVAEPSSSLIHLVDLETGAVQELLGPGSPNGLNDLDQLAADESGVAIIARTPDDNLVVSKLDFGGPFELLFFFLELLLSHDLIGHVHLGRPEVDWFAFVIGNHPTFGL